MSTYATLEDVAAAGVVIDDPVRAQTLLDQCELDIDDLVVRTYGRDVDTGLRLDPTVLPLYQETALRDATVFAFEFHIAMGEDFFIRPQPDSVTGPAGASSYTGRLPTIGPKAYRSLERAKLLHVSGTIGDVRIYDPLWWQRSWWPDMPMVYGWSRPLW